MQYTPFCKLYKHLGSPDTLWSTEISSAVYFKSKFVGGLANQATYKVSFNSFL
jgi:hypothetical protein